jgi:hypothetical protein
MTMIMSKVWDYVSELRPPTGLLLIPKWYMSMENHGGMISTEETSWFIHHSSPSKPEERSKGIIIWCCDVFCSYLQGIFAARKNLRHRTDGFTFHPQEGVMQIYIALRNPSPWPGMNPRTLGLMASTLTIAPPRRHDSIKMLWLYFIQLRYLEIIIFQIIQKRGYKQYT